MGELSDLEIVKRCAEAMGYQLKPRTGAKTTYGHLLELPWGTQWNPLIDGSQCFEMIERFKLNIGHFAGGEWSVGGAWFKEAEYPKHADLKRAICLCVALSKESK